MKEINVTWRISQDFFSFVRTDGYLSFCDRYKSLFHDLETYLSYTTFPVKHRECEFITKNFKKLVDYTWKFDRINPNKRISGYFEVETDYPHLLNDIKDAVISKNWLSFYTKYRDTFDYIIRSAREQHLCDFRLYDKNNKVFLDFQNMEKGNQSSRVTSTRNSGEMIRRGGMSNSSYDGQEPSPPHRVHSLLPTGLEYSWNNNQSPPHNYSPRPFHSGFPTRGETLSCHSHTLKTAEHYNDSRYQSSIPTVQQKSHPHVNSVTICSNSASSGSNSANFQQNTYTPPVTSSTYSTTSLRNGSAKSSTSSVPSLPNEKYNGQTKNTGLLITDSSTAVNGRNKEMVQKTIDNEKAGKYKDSNAQSFSSYLQPENGSNRESRIDEVNDQMIGRTRSGKQFRGCSCPLESKEENIPRRQEYTNKDETIHMPTKTENFDVIEKNYPIENTQNVHRTPQEPLKKVENIQKGAAWSSREKKKTSNYAESAGHDNNFEVLDVERHPVRPVVVEEPSALSRVEKMFEEEDAKKFKTSIKTNTPEIDESLRLYEADLNQKSNGDEMRNSVMDRFHQQSELLHRRISGEPFSEDLFSPEDEYDESFNYKLRSQQLSHDKKMEEMKEKRRMQQEQFEKDMQNIRNERNARFKALLAALMYKHRFEEQEKDCMDWINGCRKKITKLLEQFHYFAQNIQTDYRRLKNMDSETTHFFQSEKLALFGYIRKVYDLMWDDFENLKHLEKNYPDKLFIRVLQKCVSNVANRLIVLGDLMNDVENYEHFTKVQVKFEELRPELIYSTSKLREIERNGNISVEYQNVQFPQISNGVTIEEIY